MQFSTHLDPRVKWRCTKHPQPHLTWPFRLLSSPPASHTLQAHSHSVAFLLALSSSPDSSLDNSSSLCSNVTSSMMQSPPKKYIQPLKRTRKSFPSSLLCPTFSCFHCTYHLLIISLFMTYIVFFCLYPPPHHHHPCLPFSDRLLIFFFSLIMLITIPRTELALNKYLLNEQINKYPEWKG